VGFAHLKIKKERSWPVAFGHKKKCRVGSAHQKGKKRKIKEEMGGAAWLRQPEKKTEEKEAARRAAYEKTLLSF